MQSFTMTVADSRRSRSARTVSLFVCNRPVPELAELIRAGWAAWRRVGTWTLAPGATELRAELPGGPVVACNLLIQVASLHVNAQAASLEVLQCPRCSRHGAAAFCFFATCSQLGMHSLTLTLPS